MLKYFATKNFTTKMLKKEHNFASSFFQKLTKQLTLTASQKM